MANPNPSPSTRFGPGNTFGRGLTKEQAKQRDEAKAFALSEAHASIDRLKKIRDDPQPLDNISKSAADSILDRGLGKPAQEITLADIERERDEMRQFIQAVTNALEPFPEARAAVLAALEPYLAATENQPAREAGLVAGRSGIE